MIEYTDKTVARIAGKLETLDLVRNTLLIFTADNGTAARITTKTKQGDIRGMKGRSTDAGTHVPLIVSWPHGIKKGFVFDGLIEFSDFYPTLANAAGMDATCDGKSFYALMTGKKYRERETVFVHYDPGYRGLWDKFRNRFVRTKNYKLYQDGRFYNLSTDLLEENALNAGDLTGDELKIKSMLQQELNKAPEWINP
jgi:arylsulfatase A